MSVLNAFKHFRIFYEDEICESCINISIVVYFAIFKMKRFIRKEIYDVKRIKIYSIQTG